MLRKKLRGVGSWFAIPFGGSPRSTVSCRTSIRVHFRLRSTLIVVIVLIFQIALPNSFRKSCVIHVCIDEPN